MTFFYESEEFCMSFPEEEAVCNVYVDLESLLLSLFCSAMKVT